jgi:hypothetical protein
MDYVTPVLLASIRATIFAVWTAVSSFAAAGVAR